MLTKKIHMTAKLDPSVILKSVVERLSIKNKLQSN
uniref:Uncharacterized protein n=1 Tax=Arundo donax TaxID=35708 RepID=A0A0A9AK46_ARUDO